MPVYFMLSKSKFSREEKERVTKVVTDVHCTITGTPSTYVTILFLSGYRLKKGRKAMLLGYIQKDDNRTQDNTDHLKHGLLEAIANILHISATQVGLQLLGIHAGWVWERGAVLPPTKQKEDNISSIGSKHRYDNPLGQMKLFTHSNK